MRPSKYLIIAWALAAVLVLALRLLAAQESELTAVFEHASWLLLGALVLVSAIDALSAKRVPEIHIERHVPEQLAVGKAHNIELLIVPPPKLKTPLKISLHDAYPAQWQVASAHLEVDILPQRGLKTTYLATPLQRGEALFGDIQYSLRSALGLWERHRHIAAATHVKVLPDFSKILGANLIGMHKWLQLMGAKRVRRHGQGQDFHQLRDHAEGDDLRHIDWKATSKMQKTITRTYQEERDQQVIFLIDCGRNMRSMSGDLSHFDHVLNAMLLLSYTALKHDDAVGLMTFNHPNLRHIPARKGVNQLQQLINGVYDVQPTQMAADYETAINHLLHHQKRRALVIVLTQLDQENNEHMVAQLRRLKKRCAVLIASIQQTERTEIAQTPLKNLQDAHTYLGAQMYASQEQQLLKQLQAQRVLHLNVPAQQLSTALINQYLELKRHGSW